MIPEDELKYWAEAADEIITDMDLTLAVHMPVGTSDAELTTNVHTTPIIRLFAALRAVVAAGRECDRETCASEDWHGLMHAVADLIAQYIEEGREDDNDDTGR